MMGCTRSRADEMGCHADDDDVIFAARLRCTVAVDRYLSEEDDEAIMVIT